jgi:hypothetical protein
LFSTGINNAEFCFQIIGAIKYYVVFFHYPRSVRTIKLLPYRLNDHERIIRPESLCCNFRFFLTDVDGCEKWLPVQITCVYYIEITDANFAHACTNQVLERWAASASRPYNQDAAVFQFLLSPVAYFL